MRFTETPLGDVWIIDLDRHEDHRGYFARAFCAREFAEHGITAQVVQSNLSYSARRGTVRGMHFQYPPAAENKLVRCISGAIVDVVVDLRPESPTYLQHTSVELSTRNHRSIVVPPRFAHGFMSLTDDAEVLYLVSEFYTPAEAGGLRWDDPALGIEWPGPMTTISDQDASWPDLARQRARIETSMRLTEAPS
jgi:dTDP-4-dehydrorhamnose 3,5-epimerase